MTENLPAVLEGVIDAECGACCSHGGMCILNYGHAGKHDTKYCQWDDADSISKQEADEISPRSLAETTSCTSNRFYAGKHCPL